MKHIDNFKDSSDKKSSKIFKTKDKSLTAKGLQDEIDKLSKFGDYQSFRDITLKIHKLKYKFKSYNKAYCRLSMNSGDWEWFTAGKWYEISRYGEENKGDDEWKSHLDDVTYDVYIIDNYDNNVGFKYQPSKISKSMRHFGTYFYTKADIRKFKLDKINGVKNR